MVVVALLPERQRGGSNALEMKFRAILLQVTSFPLIITIISAPECMCTDNWMQTSATLYTMFKRRKKAMDIISSVINSNTTR